MKKTKVKKEERKSTLGMTMLMLLLVVIILAAGIIGCGFDAHVPITMSCGVLMIYGVCYLRIEWTELRDAICNSASASMECMIIILLIGCTVGTWVSSGTVPMIICIGLKVFSPKFFLVSILVICAVMSMITGSSWTTMGTVGIAFMGVGYGLGINPAITAGAIVCGAYFGDKQSPLSDTTNFAAAVAKTNLYKHVHSMWYTTGPAFAISAIIFLVLGFQSSGTVDNTAIAELIDGLNAAFNFHPILILPLIMMIVLIAIKFPAIPTLLLCSVVGAAFTMIFQGATVAQAGSYWYSGFVGDTGNATIDSLLTRGGLSSMYYTVALMIVSLAMAGLMERCGIIENLMARIEKLTKSRVGLVASQLVSGYCLSYIAADPYLTMLLPANAFGDSYDEHGLDRSVLSRTLEDSGTLVAPMVPWGSNGVYAATTLGVATTSYLPFYFMGFITPIFSILCAITGFGMFKAVEGNEANEINEAEEVNL